MRLTLDFTWQAIFAVNIKLGYTMTFCGKGKNQAIWVTLFSIGFATTKT